MSTISQQHFGQSYMRQYRPLQSCPTTRIFLDHCPQRGQAPAVRISAVWHGFWWACLQRHALNWSSLIWRLQLSLSSALSGSNGKAHDGDSCCITFINQKSGHPSLFKHPSTIRKSALEPEKITLWMKPLVGHMAISDRQCTVTYCRGVARKNKTYGCTQSPPPIHIVEVIARCFSKTHQSLCKHITLSHTRQVLVGMTDNANEAGAVNDRHYIGGFNSLCSPSLWLCVIAEIPRNLCMMIASLRRQDLVRTMLAKISRNAACTLFINKSWKLKRLNAHQLKNAKAERWNQLPLDS